MSVKKTLEQCKSFAATTHSEDDDVESPVSQSQYPSATSSLISKWKRSIKRKMTPSAPGSVSGHRDLGATITLEHMMSFDEPANDETSDMTQVHELSVMICRDGIKINLLDMMKQHLGDTKLVEALEDTDNNNVHELLQAASKTERNLALLWAAFMKRADLVQTLLPGANLDYCTAQEGLTALHLAAFSGSAECVRYLLNAGAKMTRPQVLTPLHCAALGHSTECIGILLNEGANVNLPLSEVKVNDEPQDSALHCAIRANAPDCMNQLLCAGADPAVIGQGGLTPLHVAADLGYIECAKVLLDCGTDVKINAKTQDRRGYTALHITAEDEYVDLLQMLLDHGADASLRNQRGQTPLHVAAKVQCLECISALIPISDVNSGDADRRTPLHAAVGRSAAAAEAVELLVKTPGINVNMTDRYGHTPIHVAALNELPKATAVLIRNGADLTARTKKGSSALGLVIRKAPAALYAIEESLDSSIRMTYETNKDRDCELKLDFRTLLQGSGKVEVLLLSTFIEEGHPELLQHPLCQAFLHLKWHTIKKFYLLRIILSFLFVTFLSVFILGANQISIFKYISEYKILQSVVFYGLIFFTCLEVIRKIYGFTASISGPSTISISAALKNYVFQLDNFFEWFSLICIPIFYLYFKQNCTLPSWSSHLGAFAILAGWANIMIMIGQLPIFGAYVSMYTCVLREFIKLLFAYIWLLIGFTISFCVVFQKDFKDPLSAMIRVLVMMTGELEFKDLETSQGNEPPANDTNATSVIANVLFEKYDFNVSQCRKVKNKTEELICYLISNTINNSKSEFAIDTEKYSLDFMAYCIFVLFLLFVTVALMNLLVGIAVHDIHGLRASAGLAKLQRQADLIRYVETALSKSAICMCRCCSFNQYTKLRCVHNTRQARTNSTIMHIKPHNVLDTRLPRDIVKAVYDVAKCHKSRSSSMRLSTNKFKRVCKRETSTASTVYETMMMNKKSEADTTHRRRTQYIKSSSTENMQRTDSLSDIQSSMKQMSEEMQELRQILYDNQSSLHTLLTTNQPLTPSTCASGFIYSKPS